MREWCPAFYGTLKLQGKVQGNDNNNEGEDELSEETAPSQVRAALFLLLYHEILANQRSPALWKVE